MAIGQALLEDGGDVGKAPVVAMRATPKGEQLVRARTAEELLEENGLLLQAILVELRVLNVLMFPAADLDNERGAFTDREDLIRR